MSSQRFPPVTLDGCGMHLTTRGSLVANLAMVASLRPVIVRRGESHLLISLSFGSNPRTLQRPLVEELHRSLSRMQKALGVLPELLDERGACIPGNTVAWQAWSAAVRLRAAEQCVPVLFNPPEVTSIECPSAPHVGIPLCPFVRLSHADAACVRFSWRALHQDGIWEQVGEGPSYTPTQGDVGSQLQVMAVASLRGNIGARETDASPLCEEMLERTLELGVVRTAPERPVLERRLRSLAEKCSSSDMRVMSYNLSASHTNSSPAAQHASTVY